MWFLRKIKKKQWYSNVKQQQSQRAKQNLLSGVIVATTWSFFITTVLDTLDSTARRIIQRCQKYKKNVQQP